MSFLLARVFLTGVDAAGDFVRGSQFDGLSDATLISLADNAMCAACVRPIIWLVSQHVFPRVLDTDVGTQSGPSLVEPGDPHEPRADTQTGTVVEGVTNSSDSGTQAGGDPIPALIDEFVNALENTIDVTRSDVAAFLRASEGGHVGSERVRDLYPLPAIPLHEFSLEGSGGKH